MIDTTHLIRSLVTVSSHILMDYKSIIRNTLTLFKLLERLIIDECDTYMTSLSFGKTFDRHEQLDESTDK